MTDCNSAFDIFEEFRLDCRFVPLETFGPIRNPIGSPETRLSETIPRLDDAPRSYLSARGKRFYFGR